MRHNAPKHFRFLNIFRGENPPNFPRGPRSLMGANRHAVARFSQFTYRTDDKQVGGITMRVSSANWVLWTAIPRHNVVEWLLLCKRLNRMQSISEDSLLFNYRQYWGGRCQPRFPSTQQRFFHFATSVTFLINKPATLITPPEMAENASYHLHAVPNTSRCEVDFRLLPLTFMLVAQRDTVTQILNVQSTSIVFGIFCMWSNIRML